MVAVTESDEIKAKFSDARAEVARKRARGSKKGGAGQKAPANRQGTSAVKAASRVRSRMEARRNAVSLLEEKSLALTLSGKGEKCAIAYGFALAESMVSCISYVLMPPVYAVCVAIQVAFLGTFACIMAEAK